MATARQKQIERLAAEDALAAKNAEPVACPKCNSADGITEVAYRDTTQPVAGLKRGGDADDYSSFDWHDDVLVVGYSCECGWEDSVDTAKVFAEIAKAAQAIRDGMPKATT